MQFRFLFLFFIPLSCFLVQCSTTSKKEKDVKFSRSWARSTTPAIYLGYRHPATISPIIYKDLVIEGNSIDGLYAYYKKSGHQAWRLEIENGLEGLYLHEDKLYFGANDGKFYQVDAATGEEQWSLPLQSESTTAPLVQGNFIFHLAMNGSLYALEKGSGRVLWVKTRPPRDPLTVRGATQPLFDDGRLYVGHSDGYFSAYQASTGGRIWEKRLADNKKFNDIDARPVITNKCILVSNYSDTLYCLNKGNGQPLWKLRESGGFQPLHMSGDKLLYSTLDAVLMIDADSGKVLKRHKVDKHLGHPTTAIPYKDWLIVGYSEGPIVIMNSSNGKIQDRFFPGRGIMAPPTVDVKTGSVYFISQGSNLYKLNVEVAKGRREFQWARQ